MVDGSHGRADRSTWASEWKHRRPGVHGAPNNPLVGLYTTSDGRYISFVMMQPTKFWADVCRHVDLPELADDPRFATVERSPPTRRKLWSS